MPRLIVGNKMDLVDSHQVSRQRAQKFADSNDLPLFEVSSKSIDSQADIDGIFLTLAIKLKQNKPLIPHTMDKVSCVVRYSFLTFVTLITAHHRRSRPVKPLLLNSCFVHIVDCINFIIM